MCGFSGSVEIGRKPTRRSAGALKAGRTVRADRASVFVIIIVEFEYPFLRKVKRTTTV
jgi:hypothetical protein